MSTPQWKSITDSLRIRIESGELAAGHRIPSEIDVAAEWGVSRQTAHRAIHELQRLGLVARQRRWGTVVAPRIVQRAGRVAFIVDQFAQIYNFPSGQTMRGIQDGLGDDVDLICRECKQDAEQEARLLRKLSEETDGIIIYPTSNPRNTHLLQKLSDTKPLVVLDRVPAGLNVDAVVSDNEEATVRAMQALVERGHRRVGFFSFRKPDFSTVSERFSAFQKVLEDAGVTDVSPYVRWFPRELDSYPEQFVQAIYDALYTLVHQPDPITALFCVQDSFAAASLQACDAMQLRIPEDLELATFNEWPPMMLRRPWQTHRIVQNAYAIGLEAATVLAQRISGSTEPRRVHRVRAEFFVADAGLQPDRGTGAPTPHF